MARPAKVSPPSYPDASQVGQYVSGLPVQPSPPLAAADYLPASVTGAWDALRVALGQTVPAHVTAAKLSAGRLMQTVR